MTLPRAIQLTQGVLLQVIAFKVDPYQGVLTTPGTLQITADSVQPDQYWRIERLVVESSSANQLTLTVTDGSHTRDYGRVPLPTPGVGAFKQVAEYDSPLTLLGSQQFTLLVGGLSVGDSVSGTLQYMIVTRVPGRPG